MIYLAYQADERQFSKERILKIVRDWFIPATTTTIEKRIEKILKSKEYATKSFLELAAQPGLFSMAVVRGEPWTPIGFCYRSEEATAMGPENFTGLLVWANHSSSEDYVRIWNLQPRLDVYLMELGIKWQDRHKLEI
jgi:hypothetical protein